MSGFFPSSTIPYESFLIESIEGLFISFKKDIKSLVREEISCSLKPLLLGHSSPSNNKVAMDVRCNTNAEGMVDNNIIDDLTF